MPAAGRLVAGLLFVASALGAKFDDVTTTETNVGPINTEMVHTNKRMLGMLGNIEASFAKLEADQNKADKALHKYTAEEAKLEALVADLKTAEEKMQAVTADFDLWAAPKLSQIDKTKTDIKNLHTVIASLKAKKVSLNARMAKATAAIPVLQAEIDATLAQLKAKGAHSMTGKTVDVDKMQASESDEDMATMLAKNEAIAENEEKLAAKEAKAGPKASENHTGSSSPAAPAVVVPTVVKTGSMSSADMPCCVTHKGPECLNSAVSKCVCMSHRRPSCCTKAWDLTCVDAVMQFGCATCSGASLSATPFLSQKLQTGGRRTSQVYLN